MNTGLPKATEQRIYRLSVLCTFLAAASLIVPRFVANPEGGFAEAASAAVTLLSMLAATFLFSLYLLAVTVRRYGIISLSAKIAGIGPSVVLAATLFLLFDVLGY